MNASTPDLKCRWAEPVPGTTRHRRCTSPKLVGSGKARVPLAACAECYCRNHPPADAQAPPLITLTVPLPTLGDVPCPHRGDVISWCHGCGGAKPERHTYRCDHPKADWDACVPVPAHDVEFPETGIRSCRRCPLRPTRQNRSTDAGPSDGLTA